MPTPPCLGDAISTQGELVLGLIWGRPNKVRGGGQIILEFLISGGTFIRQLKVTCHYAIQIFHYAIMLFGPFWKPYWMAYWDCVMACQHIMLICSSNMPLCNSDIPLCNYGIQSCYYIIQIYHCVMRYVILSFRYAILSFNYFDHHIGKMVKWHNGIMTLI